MTSRPVVLNVNDHAANLYMVSKFLRAAGFTVIEAKTGREALDLAATHDPQPAVAVLDVHLPDISGFDVCRMLKADAATKDIKVLHTSASFVKSDHKVEGLSVGADGYLTQPFEPQDLVATVRSLLRLHTTEADLHARNELLATTNRRKDEFLAMLAHELRNPLATLQMGLPILERHAPRDELEGKALAAMRRQTTLLTQLVDDLLDAARVTQGRIELNLVNIDLAQLVRTVAEGMRERALAPRGQELLIEIPPAKLVVAGDPVRLEQILTNLLDNASKYSNRGTRITVTMTATAQQIEITVRDQGVGIDPEQLPTMFDLFAQAETSLARSAGGLGIGLTLVKALTEMHGGTVHARSEGLGHGSVFCVTLPRIEVSQTVPLIRPPVPAGTTSFRIVVIDDNEDGRFMLRSLCELRGHEVVEAADGLEGVARTVEAAPDIAFVDIGLPGIDGYEVARQLRQHFTGPQPYLVALSGYGSDEHRARAFDAGFDEHIAKPMQLDQLERVVAKVRDRASSGG